MSQTWAKPGCAVALGVQDAGEEALKKRIRFFKRHLYRKTIPQEQREIENRLPFESRKGGMVTPLLSLNFFPDKLLFMEKAATKHFKYIFKLNNGKKNSYRVELALPSLDLVRKHTGPYPDWTTLAHHQCPNCPLKAADTTHCPVATSLVEVIEFFRDTFSYEKALIGIETEERSYYKETEVQHGLSSLVGIYMTTAGCPVLNQLRPMVQFHLPLASPEETKYRALSMYMLAQYFRKKEGKEPDFDFTGLKKIYDEIRTVNMYFSKRLQNLGLKDASANALVGLDCFAWEVAFSVDQHELNDLKSLFHFYL